MIVVKIAEHNIRIDNRYMYINELFKDYIVDEEAELIVKVSDEELEYENKDGGNWSLAYLESLAIYRKICEYLLKYNIVLFHCSALEIDGKAILFTAPSGVGKSTHTRLWREKFKDRVRMINDDKPLLAINKEIIVYGTPYGGKDNIQNNIKASVCAIVVLHRDVDNNIVALDRKDSYPLLFNQTYHNDKQECMIKVLDLVNRLTDVPVFSVGCTISLEAVTTVYDKLKGLDIL